MSLLDGLRDAMINPLFDAITESDMDNEFDFELALEAAVDKQIELSDADIAAILDDDNPDNIVADMSRKDESISKIADDAVDEELATLESMLDDLLASESEMPEEDNPADDPECIACETDDEDDAEEDDEDYVTLDSLLDSVFKN